MRQIINNRYIKCINHHSKNELFLYLDNYNKKKQLFINNTNETKYLFSLVCCHSLLNDIEFILSFSSDYKSFDILLWDTTCQLVLYTGANLYLIDEQLKIKKYLDYMSPLIGLLITPLNNLIILEEISLKIMNPNGEIIHEEQFDLVENYKMKEDKLYIETEDGLKIIRIF